MRQCNNNLDNYCTWVIEFYHFTSCCPHWHWTLHITHMHICTLLVHRYTYDLVNCDNDDDDNHSRLVHSISRRNMHRLKPIYQWNRHKYVNKKKYTNFKCFITKFSKEQSNYIFVISLHLFVCLFGIFFIPFAQITFDSSITWIKETSNKIIAFSQKRRRKKNNLLKWTRW